MAGPPSIARLRRVAGRALGVGTRPRQGPVALSPPPPVPVPRRLLVAGHRGTCVGAPENTMAAFRYAAAVGVDAVELDVQWTRATPAERSRMVVIHGRSLERTTDGRGLVAQCTWSELRRLDAGSWYGPTWAGERLPLFEEVLAYLAGTDLRALAEVKMRDLTPGQALAYVEAVQAAGMVGRTVASAFHTAVLTAVREASGGTITTGIIEQANPRSDLNVRARGSAYYPTHTSTSRAQVTALRAAGVEVFTWPARDERDLAAALALGVDGVTADDPAMVLRRLAVSGRPGPLTRPRAVSTA